MKTRTEFKLSGMQLALLALAASAALQFFCFVRLPGRPMADVSYSIFAAQNLLAHGQMKSLNMLADFRDDLAQIAELQWMVHFPPGQSLLYAVAMSLGLSAGAATKALGLAGIVVGGLGWIFLARHLGASKTCTAIVAAIYPWLPLAVMVYRLYETEQVALAIMPWFCLSLLKIEPIAVSAPASSQTSAAGSWRYLLITILLALLLVTIKWSMNPVFLAAALYLVLQDGVGFSARSAWWKAVMVGLLLFPGFLYLLVNHLYGARIQLTPAQSPNLLFQLARNTLNSTVSGTLGWDNVTGLKIVQKHAFDGLIDVLSLASLTIWIAHFRHVPLHGRMRSFGILLAMLTVALWLSLCASTYLGNGQWDLSAEERLYLPITLMWLLFCVISLDGMRARDIFRSMAFYALALPAVLTAIIEIRGEILRPPYPAMPQSGLVWTASSAPDHAAFLSGFAASRSRKPDLLVAAPSMMNELDVPSVFSIPPGHHYWSSKDLEVWALIDPSQEKTLLADFSGAMIQRVVTPPRFPYSFYIIDLKPMKNAKPRKNVAAWANGSERRS